MRLLCRQPSTRRLGPHAQRGALRRLGVHALALPRLPGLKGLTPVGGGGTAAAAGRPGAPHAARAAIGGGTAAGAGAAAGAAAAGAATAKARAHVGRCARARSVAPAWPAARAAIATVMLLAPRERADAAIFRVRDGVRLAASEIAGLASQWGIAPAVEVKSPRLAPEPHWSDIVRGMVREAPLPSLMVAFLLGVLVTRR